MSPETEPSMHSGGDDVAKAERRRDYRIHYPVRLRPRIRWDGGSGAVVNLSEGGIRFVAGSCADTVGTVMQGAVTLRCGATVEISGRVVRAGGDELALSLSQGFSFSTVLREQRALRQHQPYAS